MDHSSSGRKTGGAMRRGPQLHKKVAIVGGGPSGVTCAHDLFALGCDVTLFEGASELGGMLRYGIPEYRLPRNVLIQEIDSLLEGVEVRLGTKIGVDVPFASLQKEFDAIFVAVGAQKGRSLPIENVDADGVVNGIDFLLNVNLGYKVELGKRVVVIGGGNVAMDVARTAAREAGIDFAGVRNYDAALDIARAAMRAGAPEVSLVCLESVQEMPAHEDEIVETLREGIEIFNSRGPTRVVVENGKCVGLETIRCLSVYNDAGKFSPQFEAGSESIIECDSVLLAIGQQPDLGFLGEAKIETAAGGFVAAEPKTMATNLAGVYVGGDMAFGARTAIEGIADGRRAALSILRYLGGEPPRPSFERPTLTKLTVYHAQPGFDRVPRFEVPTISVDRRTGVSEVETGYSREEAQEEALRCFKCNLTPMVDYEKCVLCSGCVDVCPFGCLRIVPVERLEGDSKVAQLADARHGVALQEMAVMREPSQDRWFAMVKDDELCNRCGLCIERCPVGAMWMGKLEDEYALT